MASETCFKFTNLNRFHLIFITGLQIISAALTGPQDTVVTVGSATTFTCSCAMDTLEPRLDWKYKPLNTNEYQYLRCEHSTAPKCDVTLSNNNRTSSLTIRDVQLSDAGQYKCTECWNAKGVTKATLSVVESKGCQWNISSPSHSVAESEVFEIECDIDNVSKWWTPVIIHCLPDTPAEVASNLYFSQTNTIVITATSQLNQAKFNCHIVPPSNISSSSIHLWTSPAINVKYGVRNMSINVEHRDHSTVLTCSADSNPAPTYQWTDSTSSFTSNDTSLVLNRPVDCTSASTTLTCTAVGFNGALQTENVTVNWTYSECRNKIASVSSDGRSVLPIIFGCTSVVVTLGAVIAICIYMYIKLTGCQCKRGKLRRPDVLPKIKSSSLMDHNDSQTPSATVVVYAEVQRQGRRHVTQSHPVVGSEGVRGADDDDDDSSGPELPPKLDTTQPAAAQQPENELTYAELAAVVKPGQRPKPRRSRAPEPSPIYAAIDHRKTAQNHHGNECKQQQQQQPQVPHRNVRR